MKRSVPILLILLTLVACDTTGTEATPSPTPSPAPSSPSDEGAPSTPPTLSTEFASADTWWDLQQKSLGSISFGNANSQAIDGLTARISLAGSPPLGPNDYAGPPKANQIATDELLSFGIFRARVRSASCAAGEEVINGIFLYSNDGSDGNGNGIVDNNEVDIEIPCSAPNLIFLTIWTDYTDDTHLRKVTRRIDLETGDYRQTPPGEEGTYHIEPAGMLPEAALPGTLLTSNFYEMGFEWHSDEVRYFIVVDGTEITLWNFTDAAFIPQKPASFMFNLWHSKDSWETGDPADYPQSDAVMEIDWFKYWED